MGSLEGGLFFFNPYENTKKLQKYKNMRNLIFVFLYFSTDFVVL